MEMKPAYEDLEKRLSRLKNTLARRRLNQEKEEENRRLYQALFEHAGVAMMLRDLRTGRMVAFNKKAHEDLGYTAEEYKNRNIPETVVEEYQKNLKTILKKGDHTNRSIIRRKDGAMAEVLRSGVVIHSGGQQYVHTIRVDLSGYTRTMEKLRESEERYRSVLESMDEGYYEVDLAGNLTFFNSAFVKIYGRPAEELTGMNNREYMTPETAQKVYSFFNELFRTGKTPSRTLDYEVIQKDGSITSAEISASLIKNSEGRITGFRGLVRDVTEKNQMEKELRERESMYRALFDHAGFAITLIDPRTGNRVACNKMTYEGLGYTEEEYQKLLPEEFLATPDEEMLNHVLITLEKGSHTYLVKLKRKGGEIRDFFRSSVRVKIGGKSYIHSISVDVTEQMRAERGLQESEALFRNIFQGAADAIFLFDLEKSRILDANEKAYTYLGYGREEFLKKTYEDLVENPDEKETVLQQLQAKGVSFHESLHRKKDGTLIFVEISSCLMDYQGKKAVLSIVRDVTERKKMESELDQYRETLEEMVERRTLELEAAQRELIQKEKLAVLGQVTATVSHELRNPLGVIQSSSYYLQKKLEDKDEKTDKHLKRIDEQVAVCDAIVGDLLEYTRGAHVERMKDSIGSWLGPLLDRFFKHGGFPVIRKIPENLPMIDHDPVKMQRVVLNLLNNAVQAVQDKAETSRKSEMPYEPFIRLTVKDEASGMVIEIEDNGIGMTKKIQDQAFTPLFTTRSRGTGLGLANVLKIMEEHGGKIALTSSPGQGTTATLFLPFKQVAFP
jgi:PAS domain S-box-containing protein